MRIFRTLPKFLSVDVVIIIVLFCAPSLGHCRNLDETVLLIDYLQRNHFEQIDFEEIEAQDIVDKFLEAIEPAKLFLLQSDIDAFYQDIVPTLKSRYLINGKIDPIIAIHKQLEKRIADRLSWVSERLSSDWDFSSNQQLQLNRSDAAWFSNASEADDYWEKTLKHKLIEKRLLGQSLETAIALLKEEYDESRQTISSITDERIKETFLDAYCKIYGPHTLFLGPESATFFEDYITNSYVGLGIVLDEIDGKCIIVDIVPGSSAFLSKQINLGDQIVGIEDENGDYIDTSTLNFTTISKLFDREEDDNVIFHVLTPDEQTPRKVMLEENSIALQNARASGTLYTLDNPQTGKASRIGVVLLPSFYLKDEKREASSSASEDVANLLDQMKKEEVDSVILDLRNNPGGSVEEAVKIVGLFVRSSPVAILRNPSGLTEIMSDEDASVTWEGPLAVLLNSQSASASEIAAGSLQLMQRAVLVGGKKTFGKGTAQISWPLSLNQGRRNVLADFNEIGIVNITTQKFYLPNGTSIQKTGVIPDIQFPNYYSDLMGGEEIFRNALSAEKIEPSKRSDKTDLSGVVLLDSEIIDLLNQSFHQRLKGTVELECLKLDYDLVEHLAEKEMISVNLKERQQQYSEYLDENYLSYKLSKTLIPIWKDKKIIRLADVEKMQQERQQLIHQQLLERNNGRLADFFNFRFYTENKAEQTIKIIDIRELNYRRLISILQHMDLDDLANRFEEDPATLISFVEDLEIAEWKNDKEILSLYQKNFSCEGDEESVRANLICFLENLLGSDPFLLRQETAIDIPLMETLQIAVDLSEIIKRRSARD